MKLRYELLFIFLFVKFCLLYRFSYHENGQLSRQSFLKEFILEGSIFMDLRHRPSIHQYSPIH